MNVPTPSPSPQPSPSPAPESGPVASFPPPRPAWVPEAFHDGEAGWKADEFGQHYGELAQFKAQADERLKTVPEKPEGYKPELPKDFKIEGLPDGVEIKINDKDPRLAAARTIAKDLGLSQDQFSRLLTLEAQRIAADAIADADELKKLGDKGAERITGVDRFLKSVLPAAKYDALRKSGDMRTAAAVELIEDLQAKIAGSGAMPPKPGEAPPPAQPKSVAERMYPNLPSATKAR